VKNMADIFLQVIQKLQSIGAFNFLFPFLLIMAITYGLLRKSQIFGDPNTNQAVNGVVSLVIGFMVLGYPLLAGVDVETQMATFFMHSLAVMLIFIVGLMGASMFLKPNLPEQIEEWTKNKITSIIIICIGLGVLVFVTSGLVNLVVGDIFLNISEDFLWSIIAIVVLIIPIAFILRGSPPSNSENKKGEKDVSS